MTVEGAIWSVKMSYLERLNNASDVVFEVEKSLQLQQGLQPLPFPGMDKTGSAMCTFFRVSTCRLGTLCPLRHVSGDKSIVCKHWLRGLCKKGDQCEFLHEYDVSKMPECFFYSKYNACSNKECPFRHIDPESKLKDCPWYDRGFCRHGPHCKNRHRRRVMCLSFLNGFCPDGPKCLRSHPNFDLPNADISSQRRQQSNFIVCHHCGEIGHKVSNCPNLTSGEGLHTNLPPFGRNFQAAPSDQTRRPLQEVTCYKCGDKGHYANKCSRGTFAFLAPTAALSHEARLKDEHATHANVPQQRLQGRRAGEMKR
ncbi:Cleavage and polyadenylation specificity factor subunit 4 [Trichinella nelsoni]|uniref:Cleavage and polyadenylation specificity factor subunit 4 n=1 Tax=Trichinella nelsoni TaxID=6336 RepID=A0A0V0RVN8_9BILA|nr:Cleavage and polyadenylation specificity factor subunit 4 [Trichinella nelsoni]